MDLFGFFYAFVADTLTFNIFNEIYLGNYAFKQNDESLVAHQKSSAAHLLRNTALDHTAALDFKVYLPHLYQLGLSTTPSFKRSPDS